MTQATQARSDDELLLAIGRDRDRKAFAELYERHKDRAYALAWQIAHDRALADEAVQEAMLRLWNGAERYEPGNARAYLLRIVARESIRIRRGQSREDRKAMDRSLSNARESASPSSEAERSEAGAALRAALARMEQEQREMVVLAVGAGLSHKDIGDLYRVPRRTVSDRVQAALERLRDELRKAGFGALAVGVAGGGLEIQDVLLEGPPAPAELLPRVLEALDVRKFSRRATQSTPSAAPIYAFLGLLGILAAGAALWWTLRPAPQPSAVPASEPASMGESQRYARTWNFDAPGSEAGLVLEQGDWLYSGEKGCMDVRSERTTFRLDLPALRLPLLVEFRFSPREVRNQKSYDVGMGAVFKGNGTELYWPRRAMQLSRPNTWVRSHAYVSARGIDHYVADRRMHLLLGEPVPQPGSLVISMAGPMLIDDLTVREIAESEVPGLEEFYAAWARVEPERRTGTQEAPGLDGAVFKFGGSSEGSKLLTPHPLNSKESKP
ncbi:MAG: sigma-70 family RNA polymerase sigma factor [Planctomycetes bacterium]|nr:sigma-70 family RNA polymerase sigma factor [Planctomycetota bacterium]